MAEYNMRFGAYTERGSKKEYNQDHYVCSSMAAREGTVGMFAVADGIGGLSRGEVASGLACRELERWCDSKKPDSISDYMQEIKALPDLVCRINRLIMSAGKEYGAGMGTTLSLLAVCQNKALLINIGDSRIYRIRRGFLRRQDKLELLTQDDSTQILRQDGSGNSYYKDVLTACLGMRDTVTPHIAEINIKRGDRFIVCSDGLYKKNPEIAMLKQLLSRFSERDSDYCEQLVKAVRQQGETDDITVVYVSMD